MSVVSVTEIITGLFHPVFQHQARDPRKLSQQSPFMSVVSVTEIITGLFHPVFQHQARDPRKLSHIVRHQDGARRDGVPGNGRVIRADRRPG